MTRVKAQSGFDEPVTRMVLSRAIERGRTRGGQGVRATAVKYLPVLKSLLISFADHSAVALPVRNYPELTALSTADLGRLTLGLGGSALCLDARDLHVSIAGMVSASQPLMDMAATLIAARNGSKTSAVKVQASRANGQKGGRPRLVPA
jgi:Protein of unknown function (DUF2442)